LSYAPAKRRSQPRQSHPARQRRSRHGKSGRLSEMGRSPLVSRQHRTALPQRKRLALNWLNHLLCKGPT